MNPIEDSRSWTIHRNNRGWPTWYQPFLEAWWIITGEWSLHQAWQRGYEYGSKFEYERIINNMGDLPAQRRNVEMADKNIKAFVESAISEINQREASSSV